MSVTTLQTVNMVFEVECEGETTIVTLLGAVPVLDWQQGQVWAGDAAVDVLNDTQARNVVVDLRRAERFGCTALSLFLGLWKAVRDRDGRMVLCNVSPDAAAVLRATGLDQVWPIVPTKQNALAAMRD